MSKYIAVALGGALGSVARFVVGKLIAERWTTTFPFGTFVINVTGSFILGFFLELASERTSISPTWKLAIATGFVGAYTTFSTFEYETFKLLESGSGISGFMNVLLSLAFGFLAVWGGVAVGRKVGPAQIPGAAIRARINARISAKPVEATLDDRPKVETSGGAE